MSSAAHQFRPPAALAGMIDAFWVLADRPAAPDGDLAPTRVLPDGCMDLIFRWRERSHRQDSADMALFMTGTTTSAQLVMVEPGTCLAGVRLRPGMARTLLDADPRMLAGRDVMATELDPAFADLAEQLAEAARSGAPAVLSVLQREAGRRCASRMGHGPPPASVKPCRAWAMSAQPCGSTGSPASSAFRHDRCTGVCSTGRGFHPSRWRASSVSSMHWR
ncbi:MAG TPA: DUF6597 domain-containing transcriptional factor [Geminicoccus sp.]|jgi:hypothetical protein|uniref:DUF6597 domain-containing transcriptional factor n=1 Tax=Geminicoccus sp. TaxID=2024832 RepID=UPI002E33E9B0|nr:DUF6597 domain-containing transcriptional factor [Geminicoccus sp.]HEX2526129.1 DUF6597 domain-containing transcriptional factor [Geminicoccus sp.]